MSNYQQQAIEFDITPPNAQTLCIMLGHVGEFGEVCEKLKKFLRGGGQLDNLNEHRALKKELLKELGDVWWYFNVHTYRHGFYLDEPNDPGDYVNSTLESLISDLLKSLAEMWSDSVVWGKPSELYTFANFNFAFQGIVAKLGLNLVTVEQSNLKKLRSRQERGLIHGEGDNR